MKEILAVVGLSLTPLAQLAAENPSLDEAIAKALQQVPAMGVLVVIVVLFLKYMKSRDEALEKAMGKMDSAIDRLAEQTRETELRCNARLSRNRL